MKDENVTASIRARKRQHKRDEKAGRISRSTPVKSSPWPEQDSTPRNGKCNVTPSVFAILPDNGKKVFEWVKKDSPEK